MLSNLIDDEFEERTKGGIHDKEEAIRWLSKDIETEITGMQFNAKSLTPVTKLCVMSQSKTNDLKNGSEFLMTENLFITTWKNGMEKQVKNFKNSIHNIRHHQEKWQIERDYHRVNASNF